MSACVTSTKLSNTYAFYHCTASMWPLSLNPLFNASLILSKNNRERLIRKFTVSISYLLSTHGGNSILLIDSMSFLWEDLLLATGSTRKFLKLWKSRSPWLPCVRTVKLHCTFDTSLTNFFISNKTVADGAISYYIDHFVQTRVSKLTYGCEGSIEYDSRNPEHQKRPTFSSVSGVQRIYLVFHVILSEVSYLLVLTWEKEKNRDC